MLELGPDEIYFHENAGKLAAAHKFEVLITAGPLSKYTAEAALKAGVPHVYPTANSVEAADKAMSILQSGDLVLVKGSRGMKMETVIERLRSR
jgi:UDP-N-acetylmuramoyl-tripeptide--D-alanyl-D-alanine ligase